METLRKPEVLIVDDDRMNRLLLKKLLSGSDYETLECENGLDCLKYCSERLPDAILMDLVMPGLNGIEVCKKLRKTFNKSELPIIVVTSKEEAGILKTTFESGANDYISKPVDKLTLLARLENQISMRQIYADRDSQRRLAERNLDILRSTGNSIPEALVVHNKEGELVYCNGFLDCYCQGNIGDSIEDVFQNIFSGAMAGFLNDIYADCVVNRNYTYDEQISLSHGEYTDLQIMTMSVGQGRDLRLWLWRDISKICYLERQLGQQVKLGTVSIFANGVAHNFNNIMCSITSAAELISSRYGDDEFAEKCCGFVFSAVERGRNLTKKMSWIGQDRLVLEDEQTKTLEAVISEVCTESTAATDKSIDFRIELEPELPLLEMGSQQVAEVLSNIVNNAIDAMEGKGQISILARHLPSRQLVELIVTDNGCGIGLDAINSIFEPFYSTKNLDVVNNVSMEGNGLGLWNVYTVLRAAGGDIDIGSIENEGTEVSMLFPIKTEMR